MIRCNSCGGNTIAITVEEKMFGTREDFVYSQCEVCKHTVLQDVPDDMAVHYPPHYYSLKKRSTLSHILSLRKSLSMKAVLKVKDLNKNTHILDYGSGRGDLMYEMHRYGYKNTWSYDPYIDHNTTSLYGTKWGMIMMHHVIEHVNSPRETLIDLKEKLLYGGMMLLRFPVIDSYAFEKYKTDWVGFDAPRHITLFSRKSFIDLAQSLNLEILSMYDDSSHFQFTVSKLYRNDRPLSDHNLLSRTLGYIKYNSQAEYLNIIGRGDQIVVLLKKK